MNVLDWTHGVREFAGRPLDVEREADAAERAAVAASLDLASCEALRVGYSLRLLDRGRAALSGQLEAEVTQACVITLDPVQSKIRAALAIELWPAGELPTGAGDGVDVLSDDGPEPFENDVIDIGRIVLERLGDLVDPYPRKPGATLSWRDERAEASRAETPFARLKGLGGGSREG